MCVYKYDNDNTIMLDAINAFSTSARVMYKYILCYSISSGAFHGYIFHSAEE